MVVYLSKACLMHRFQYLQLLCHKCVLWHGVCCGVRHWRVLWHPPLACAVASTTGVCCGVRHWRVLWHPPLACAVASATGVCCGVRHWRVLWRPPLACAVASATGVCCGVHHWRVLCVHHWRVLWHPSVVSCMTCTQLQLTGKLHSLPPLYQVTTAVICDEPCNVLHRILMGY